MNRLVDANLHYVVVQYQDGKPLLVFVGQDPALAGGPVGDPVTLELLSGVERFGRAGLPVLGQHPSGSMLFREFASVTKREEAGYAPVASYRIVDTWFDYYDPWSSMSVDATLDNGFEDSL